MIQVTGFFHIYYKFEGMPIVWQYNLHLQKQIYTKCFVLFFKLDKLISGGEYCGMITQKAKRWKLYQTVLMFIVSLKFDKQKKKTLKITSSLYSLNIYCENK
ncbi:Hypothetical_protein [Hexamita inflata]|uniref:Hypothetical_protein n=1 Tax=Hexamita inflata TaxID=28002 RepID=A0AA86UZ55_9EUKA|nr:Hypothetical protein HINF_LOCUS65595 [Hexamita inflata]